MILNYMYFIWAPNRVLKSERAVHLIAIKAENHMWCTCCRDSGLNHLFSSPHCHRWYTVILVHESTLRVFWRGGGGICFRQSLAKDGAARSHVLHPVMKLDAFIINKQKIETKFSCSFHHAYTL